MKGLLRIGEFARLGGVSVKALRFYDEQNLLRPGHVDSQTGYRYYDIEQVEPLALITNLRAAGFSIAEITALIVAEPDSAWFDKAVTEKKRALERDRAEIEGKLKVIDALARSVRRQQPNALSKFRLTTIASQLAYAVRRETPHLGAPVTEVFETAEAIVAKHNARAMSAPFMIFHDPPYREKNLTIEVCIPLIDEADANLETKLIEGSAFACAVVYAGAHYKTAALYRQMTQWIKTAGLTESGPLREVYHRFGAEQDDYRLPVKMLAKHRGDYLTELQIPISLTP